MLRNRSHPIRALFLFIIAVLFFHLHAKAQKEGNIWYFGNKSGLDFNSGKPVELLDGQIYTGEGCSTISDANGRLRFYTDGVTVWDRTHKQMPNGTGLYGHRSATQSGIFVPHPGDTNLFYVFTVPDEGKNREMCYSVIDLRKNGGLGDVVQKNIVVFGPTAEKLAAVRHANERDFWVLAHEARSNKLHAYLVDKTGFQKEGVISAVGSNSKTSGVGQLTAATDGSRIAMVCFGTGIVEMYDFDNSSGKVSNPVSLPGQSYNYGVSFSPDNTKLYVAGYHNPAMIYQYDISSGSPSQILSSQYEVCRLDKDNTIASLQIGSDGKVYIARAGQYFLDAIDNPNKAGPDCGYRDTAVPLSKACILGLPNIMQSYFRPDAIRFRYACAGDSTTFYGVHLNHGDIFSWDFGDLQSGIHNRSSLEKPRHRFTRAGIYVVTLTVKNNGSSKTYWDSVEIFKKPHVKLPEDTALCPGQSMVLKVGDSSILSYLWSDGSTDPQIVVSKPGTYRVTVSNPCGKAADSIHIIMVKPPLADLGKDTRICLGDSLVLDVKQPFAFYRWQDSSTTSRYVARQSGRYAVEVSNACSTARAEVTVDFEDCTCYLYAPNSFSPNGDLKNDSFQISYCPNTEFLLRIYNRWGECVFESRDIRQGWDGTFNGSTVPEGLYIYTTQVRGKDKSWKTGKGQVTVVR